MAWQVDFYFSSLLLPRTDLSILLPFWFLGGGGLFSLAEVLDIYLSCPLIAFSRLPSLQHKYISLFCMWFLGFGVGGSGFYLSFSVLSLGIWWLFCAHMSGGICVFSPPLGWCLSGFFTTVSYLSTTTMEDVGGGKGQGSKTYTELMGGYERNRARTME